MQGTEEEAAQDDAAARDEEGQNDAASDAGSEQGQSFATFVAEAAHLQELVAAMGDDEGIVGRICTILDRYQEQPQLLDPHLESIITPLAATLRSACGLGGKDGESLAGVREVRLACRVLYVLAKVRGFKVVIKFFPHSVTDLEPCLDLIVRQDALDVETWETRYVLLLWLSILVMVPFGLNTVDSATSGSNLIEQRDAIGKFPQRCKRKVVTTKGSIVDGGQHVGSVRKHDGRAGLLSDVIEDALLGATLANWCNDRASPLHIRGDQRALHKGVEVFSFEPVSCGQHPIGEFSGCISIEVNGDEEIKRVECLFKLRAATHRE